MTDQSFQKGYLALTAIFPGISLNAQLFWELVKDLDGEYYLKAVYDVLKTTKEIYPGTNIAAIIRDKVQALKDSSIDANALALQKEDENEKVARWAREAGPMPEDCKLELQKLGL